MGEYWVEMLKIVEGALRLDIQKVRNYTEFLAQKLDGDGQGKVASRLIKMLDSSKQSSIHPATLTPINRSPVDQESRLSLVDVMLPGQYEDAIVLDDRQQQELDRFLSYRLRADELIAAGLSAPSSVLLYGPPGCGKTQAAKHIASRLGLPLVVARLDSIVSSFLGSTSKNIRMVFEHAQRTPCILLLDEFDAIAKLRDDGNELGELKRVVNSLLQNLDAMPPETVMVAATNHEHLLDQAVWRRFEFKINIALPEEQSRGKLVSLYLGEETLLQEERAAASRMTAGISAADVRSTCIEARRQKIMRNSDKSWLQVFTDSLFWIKMASEANRRWSSSERACFLRSIDPKFFSYAMIGSCLGVSKGQVGKLLRECNDGTLDQDDQAPGT